MREGAADVAAAAVAARAAHRAVVARAAAAARAATAAAAAARAAVVEFSLDVRDAAYESARSLAALSHTSHQGAFGAHAHIRAHVAEFFA